MTDLLAPDPGAFSHFAEFVGDMEQRLWDSLRMASLDVAPEGHLQSLAEEHDAESPAPRPAPEASR